MKNIPNLYSILAFLVLFSFSLNSQNVSNDVVISQMNYCINSLTNIIHNKSMPLLEHETDQLVNNLTMEQMIGLYEIADFRSELLDATSKLNITEEERMLLKRITSIRKDNLKWNALSNALNPTMLLTGGGGNAYQLAFQLLLATARTAIEYKSMQGEQQIEELNAMWNLRKEDLKEFAELRKTALNITFKLYQKYHLSEKDRLTEETSKRFFEIITEADSRKRVRLLKDNLSTYAKIPDYYYYLGMAYVDIKEYANAKQAFDKYTLLYQKAPIFRIDEKSGCIALTRLIYEKSLSDYQKQTLIESAISNLPNNGAALIQCALIYLKELRNPQKAYNLLRIGIDNPNITDKEAIIMFAVNVLPQIKSYPTSYIAICDAISKCRNIELDSYLTYRSHTEDKIWPILQEIINFTDVVEKPWYRSRWIGIGFLISPVSGISEEMRLSLPSYIKVNPSSIHAVVEKHNKNKVTIQKHYVKDESSFTINDVLDVDCFKANPNLKYLYMESIDTGDQFRIKSNLDYAKIQSEEFPRQSEFTLTEGDIEDIIDFCKEHSSNSSTINLLFKPSEGEEKKIEVKDEITYTFKGDTLMDIPHHSIAQEGYYLKLSFDNISNFELAYKLDMENELLIPYYVHFNNEYQFYKPEYKKEYFNEIKKPLKDKVKPNKNNQSELKIENNWWKSILMWLFSIWDYLKFW